MMTVRELTDRLSTFNESAIVLVTAESPSRRFITNCKVRKFAQDVEDVVVISPDTPVRAVPSEMIEDGWRPQ